MGSIFMPGYFGDIPGETIFLNLFYNHAQSTNYNFNIKINTYMGRRKLKCKFRRQFFKRA